MLILFVTFILKKLSTFFVNAVCLLLAFIIFASPVAAYYTNMEASVVVGQPTFTANLNSVTSANFPTNSTLRGFVVDINGRLIVSDLNSHRVLIWNSVPTTNGTPADLVIGQPDFTSNTANNGGISSSTLTYPAGVYSDGDRLFVLDAGNNRLLIWNQFPTTNFEGADVVVGKSAMDSGIDITCSASNLYISQNTPGGVWVKDQKLLVSTGTTQHRVLIWNTIPTTNGQAADLVVGQPDLTTCNGTSTPTQRSLNSPRGLMVDSQNRLFVADLSSANRVMMWNSIPTENNAPADVVIGKPDFTSNTSTLTADNLSGPFGVYSNGERLFIPSPNHRRLLIWNSIPTTNGKEADIVLGQSDFTSNSDYGVTASSLGNPQMVFEYNNQLFVTDLNGDRVLIFDNNIAKPGLTVGSTESVTGDANLLQIAGSALTDSNYTIDSVEYSVNGGAWHGAGAVDGSFDSTQEYFSFTFDPKENQTKDENGDLIEGYTLRIRSTNNNTDQIDHLFYFSPFQFTEVNQQLDGYPEISFEVNKQNQVLNDNLDYYQVEVRKGDGSVNTQWETYIDNLPINFFNHKDDIENLLRGKYNDQDGEYETENLYSSYQQDSSKIEVRSKTSLFGGNYQFRVVAVDKSGHKQYSNEVASYVRGIAGYSTNSDFALAILNITGLGNPLLNSYNLGLAKQNYTTNTTAPVFYGVAWSGSEVKLMLSRESCEQDCTREYMTTANQDSRFGINVPAGDLIFGVTYKTTLSSSLDNLYNELPVFYLKVGQ